MGWQSVKDIPRPPDDRDIQVYGHYGDGKYHVIPARYEAKYRGYFEAIETDNFGENLYIYDVTHLDYLLEPPKN